MANIRTTPRIIPSLAYRRMNNFADFNGAFKDVNITAYLWSKSSNTEEHIKLSVYSVPDLKRISFHEAMKGSFVDAKIGQKFGPSWSTHWFRLDIQIPEDFYGKQVVLQWDTGSEGMVWNAEGEPLQGMTGGNSQARKEFIIIENGAASNSKLTLYIEMAGNHNFGAMDDWGTMVPRSDRSWTLDTCQLVTPNKYAQQFFWDFEVIRAIAAECTDENRAKKALWTATAMMDVYRPGVESTYQAAIELAKEFLQEKNASSQHVLTAVGHCHIDTAWLWPYAETKRKIARSWSTQIRLMDRYPDYKFVCSQAQQYEWLEEGYPTLFQRVKEKVKTGQFLPIGGTWVEMDANIPSGESFARQFLLGQRYFEKHFGERCKIFWLPDTFGYTAQLPQFIVQSDMKYFFTQKLSWNNINKFPLTTFYWTGLDGSRVLSHMAPSDTYCANLAPGELQLSVKNNKDKEFTNESLIVFGHGDGGGGPTPEHLERLERLRDVAGLPRVQPGGANEFYDRLEKNSRPLASWKGEMYFELHRGTYTTASAIKKGNRKSELLLRDLEILATLALVNNNNYKYPHARIEKLWKDVCLNQFHDVLPGSHIALVTDDAMKIYEDVSQTASGLLDEAFTSLFSSSCHPEISASGNTNENVIIFNTLPWDRTDIVEVSSASPYSAQDGPEGIGLAVVSEVVGIGGSFITDKVINAINAVSVQHTPENTFILQNKWLKVTFDAIGSLISLVDLEMNRELIPDGKKGNMLQLFEDIPLSWDAWDVEIYHLDQCENIANGSVKIFEKGPLRASLIVEKKVSATSSFRQKIILSAVSRRIEFDTEVDWDENRKFLKVEFPWNIISDYATYESVYGVVQRPTHYNTSWDYSKFEVCGHKFADLSEYGYGVAILNDCKYGYATHDNVMRLSLLRAPKGPSLEMDIGHHNFKYAVYPHPNHFMHSNVVREAYEFNVPLITRRLSEKSFDSKYSASFFSIHDANNVILDTIKRAEDSTAIVIRLYEAYGGRTVMKLKSSLPIKSIIRTNILEDEGPTIEYDAENGAKIAVKPFEIVTLKIVLK